MKKQQWQEGAIISIPVEEKRQCFGLLLEKPFVAFYLERFAMSIVPTGEVLKKVNDTLVLGIYSDIILKGTWRIVGEATLLLRNISIPDFYIHDKTTDAYFIYSKDGKITPSTKERCEGLETAAIWDTNHVIDRLKSTFGGETDIWTNSIK